MKYLIISLAFIYLLIGCLFFLQTALSKPRLCPIESFSNSKLSEEELKDCKKQPIITLEEIPTAMYLVLFWPYVLGKFAFKT